MKKITLLLLVNSISFISICQSIDNEKVTFNSEQLPSEPISNLEGYSFTVETPYAANNDELIERAKRKYEEDKANYPNAVAAAEAQYARDLDQYDRDVITAQENFKLKSEEYDKMSTVEKLALKIQAPTLHLPNKPVYRKPEDPVYREPNTSGIITFDPNVLAGSYLKLSGYNKGTEGKVLTGVVIL
ncbi:MAG: hypothetical protein IT222_01915, partial [Crocinitomix sp.]|nr:hypothetical protein [Crocinitomix sp.]